MLIGRRQAVQGLVVFTGVGCKPNAELPHKAKREAKPRAAAPTKSASGLVEISALDPTIRLDIRYATPNNFTGMTLYGEPRAFLVEPAAAALVRVHQAARAHGGGITIFDAYRPWHVTKKLWEATPPAKRNYVANPKVGSRHNRGCAIDLSMHRLSDGVLLDMPSGYDEFSRRAHRDYAGGSAEKRANRALLQRLMEAEGFRGMSNEWWHFDFVGWQRYPILDIAFDEL